MTSLLIAYLVGLACFVLLVLATLGTDRLTPTDSPPQGEKGRAS